MVGDVNYPCILSPGCNKNETEGGDHKATLRQKKLKAKTLKMGSSSKGMNSKVEGGGSEGVYDDKVLCSLTTASINSLISGKRMRTHGKVLSFFVPVCCCFCSILYFLSNFMCILIFVLLFQRWLSNVMLLTHQFQGD
jgi:hypothetical protein